MKPLVAGVTGSQEEVRAVVTLVAQVEHAQRNGLPDACPALSPRSRTRRPKPRQENP
ncbi:hypothetical protein ABZ934_24235 [Streptomyces sp. NPDC046557]|uniref:hypothetical protein n=1 Tax=Streptomyces sp. NPDC046557 TaxID=3155372 RepID=UPI0033D0EFCD